ncbi:MAG: hypothetical protein WBY44_35295 [Bryobacteraceae bacterium]
MKYRWRLAAVACATGAIAPSAARAQTLKPTKEEMTALTALSPFDRFPDGRPKVPDSLIERAKDMSAEEIFAVLPGKGFRNQYEDGFQVLHPGKKMVGRAFTVQFMPARPDLDAVMEAKARAAGIPRLYNQAALDLLQPGDVLVVDLFGKVDGARSSATIFSIT